MTHKETVEILYEDENNGREFYWPMCKVDECQNEITHDSDEYCYPHSRWYRKYKRYWNLLLTKLGV